MLKNVSVRSWLFGIISVIGCILIIDGLVNVGSAWSIWREANGVERVARIDQDLLNALQDARLERSSTLADLKLSTEDAKVVLPVLKRNRAELDEFCSNILHQLQYVDDAVPPGQIDRVSKDLADFKQLRESVDAAFELPPASRDAGIASRWGDQGDRAVAALEALSGHLSRFEGQFLPQSRPLVAVKQFGWRTRSEIGGIYATINAALAGQKPLTATQSEAVTTLFGAAGSDWRIVREEAALLQDAPVITAAVSAGQDAFFTPSAVERFKRLRDDPNAAQSLGMSFADYQKDGVARQATILNVATLAMGQVVGLAERGASAARDVILLYAAEVAVALLLTGMGLLIAQRRISRPMAAMTTAMHRLAQGDLELDVPCLDRRDEFGAMAAAVKFFQANAVAVRSHEADRASVAADNERKLRDLEVGFVAAGKEKQQVTEAMAAQLSRLASGDLMAELAIAVPADFAQLKSDFNGAVLRLRGAMQDVSTTAMTIRTGTGEISTASDDLSRRTEQQAASLEETAAALDEITATVRKTAEGARHVRAVVGDARASAEHSGEVVQQAVAAMSGIERSSREIGQIIGVIDEIAFQTNLLALNAGVEAARAGDAGRGFAVVASEVRALAQRSAEAAKEIKTLILASEQQVERGVSFVGQTGDALSRIVAQVAEIDVIVSEIASSTQEQATALDEVNTAVNQMDQVTQQNAAMVEEATAATQSLMSDTSELAGLVGRFRFSAAGAESGPTDVVVPITRTPGMPKLVSPSRAVRRGGALRKPVAVSVAQEGWKEF